MNITEWILAAVVMVAVPLTLIGVPIVVFSGGLARFAQRPLSKCYEGIELHQKRYLSDVAIVYHTYRGFLVWCTQDEHSVSASPDDVFSCSNDSCVST